MSLCRAYIVIFVFVFLKSHCHCHFLFCCCFLWICHGHCHHHFSSIFPSFLIFGGFYLRVPFHSFFDSNGFVCGETIFIIIPTTQKSYERIFLFLFIKLCPVMIQGIELCRSQFITVLFAFFLGKVARNEWDASIASRKNVIARLGCIIFRPFGNIINLSKNGEPEFLTSIFSRFAVN